MDQKIIGDMFMLGYDEEKERIQTAIKNKVGGSFDFYRLRGDRRYQFGGGRG